MLKRNISWRQLHNALLKTHGVIFPTAEGKMFRIKPQKYGRGTRWVVMQEGLVHPERLEVLRYIQRDDNDPIGIDAEGWMGIKMRHPANIKDDPQLVRMKIMVTKTW